MTENEKKKRQYKKELKSLKNKMGKHIVWFNSLSEKHQYDILFAWKYEKHSNKLEKPKTIKLTRGYRRGTFQIEYPASFKHFIIKMRRKFRSPISRIRESAIDMVLNQTKK
jgi:hypothetical protein